MFGNHPRSHRQQMESGFQPGLAILRDHCHPTRPVCLPERQKQMGKNPMRSIRWKDLNDKCFQLMAAPGRFFFCLNVFFAKCFRATLWEPLLFKLDTDYFSWGLVSVMTFASTFRLSGFQIFEDCHWGSPELPRSPPKWEFSLSLSSLLTLTSVLLDPVLEHTAVYLCPQRYHSKWDLLQGTWSFLKFGFVSPRLLNCPFMPPNISMSGGLCQEQIQRDVRRSRIPTGRRICKSKTMKTTQ